MISVEDAIWNPLSQFAGLSFPFGRLRTLCDEHYPWSGHIVDKARMYIVLLLGDFLLLSQWVLIFCIDLFRLYHIRWICLTDFLMQVTLFQTHKTSTVLFSSHLSFLPDGDLGPFVIRAVPCNSVNLSFTFVYTQPVWFPIETIVFFNALCSGNYRMISVKNIIMKSGQFVHIFFIQQVISVIENRNGRGGVSPSIATSQTPIERPHVICNICFRVLRRCRRWGKCLDNATRFKQCPRCLRSTWTSLKRVRCVLFDSLALQRRRRIL